jgi:hypothetical protein
MQDVNNGRGGYIGEFRSDGKRSLFLEKIWGNARPDLPQTKDLLEKKPRFNCEMWDGRNRYQYQRSNGEADRDIVYIVKGEDYKPEKDGLGKAEYVNQLWGVLQDTYARIPYRRVDVELKNADTISVRPQTEQINGSQCYVINAATQDSKFKIWIDPQHGYNLAQAIVSRGGEGSSFGKPEEISVSAYIRNVKFKKFADTWVPIEGDYGFNRKVIQYGFEKQDSHIKITDFQLNPDHDTLGSFEPDFIRNGASVQIIDVRGIHYIWQDGKVVDSDGHEIDLSSLKPVLLKGKALPDLAAFNISEPARNKKLLVCFWDMNQRPSRKTLQRLVGRAEELKQKGITVIVVHASKVEKNKLDDWIQKNPIPFPVGISQNDEAKTRQAWGVKSLPWLILTNKNRIVTAEGFELDELNEKIRLAGD